MENLFNKWKEKIPKYDISFKDVLFDQLTRKGGGSERSKEDRGKQFANNYELYSYAFFLGLYKDEYIPIPEKSKKIDFSHAIQYWGNKSNRLDRKDFSSMQENIFISLIAKTEIDLISLEKGELKEEDAIKKLIYSMESYTNGGLILIKEKIDDNPNYIFQPTSFLNMILESKETSTY